MGQERYPETLLAAQQGKVHQAAASTLPDLEVQSSRQRGLGSGDDWISVHQAVCHGETVACGDRHATFALPQTRSVPSDASQQGRR